MCRPGWDAIDERAIASGGVRRHHIFSGSASDSSLGLASTSSGELSSQNDRRQICLRYVLHWLRVRSTLVLGSPSSHPLYFSSAANRIMLFPSRNGCREEPRISDRLTAGVGRDRDTAKARRGLIIVPGNTDKSGHDYGTKSAHLIVWIAERRCRHHKIWWNPSTDGTLNRTKSTAHRWDGPTSTADRRDTRQCARNPLSGAAMLNVALLSR